MRRIYLDFNATAPVSAAARAAMTAAIEVIGNPSSIHAEGRAARHVVETARDRVAALAGIGREHVVFTSGGTEANRLGLELGAGSSTTSLPAVVASGLEHPSIRELATLTLPVAELDDPTVDLSSLTPGCRFAIAAVNHELGTLAWSTAGALIETIAAARAAGAGWVHVDAVQAAGKLDLAPIVAAADSVAISAHKLGGPAGVGAVIARDADAVPAIAGGHQERGRRAGTENVIGLAGFGAAVAELEVGRWAEVRALGEELERGLLAIDGVRINGARIARVGGTINAGFAGARGHAIVMALDLAGIAVSTGAACTSGSVAPSTVLTALGQRPDRAREAVRFSLGRSTTRQDVARVLEVLPPIVERARRHRAI